MKDGYMSRDRAHLADLQRKRRTRVVRIDYMPGDAARAAIEAKRATVRAGSVAATNSAVIDAIVHEWARLTGIENQVFKSPMTTGAAPELFDTFRARANDSGAGGSNATSTRTRAGANESDAMPGVSAHIAQARAPAIKSGQRVPCCGRRRRDGEPCQALSVPGKRRCKWHGGCSTGPRTPEGKARALANLRQGNRQGFPR